MRGLGYGMGCLVVRVWGLRVDCVTVRVQSIWLRVRVQSMWFEGMGLSVE